jgi:hypothetical protein
MNISYCNEWYTCKNHVSKAHESAFFHGLLRMAGLPPGEIANWSESKKENSENDSVRKNNLMEW